MKSLLSVLGITAILLHAPQQLISQNIKDSWVPLFNGKDLGGWKQLNGKAKYEVVNGEIVGTSVADSPNSFLTTEKDYGDFIFECEVMVDDSLNSGIQFRSISKPDYQNGRVHGYQMEIDPSARAWSGGIYDEARRGWLYPLDLNPKAQKAFKRNEWNRYRIEAIGNSLRTFVNGVAVANVVDNLTLSGFICLQVHGIGENKNLEGRQVKWKNIRIQTENLTAGAAANIRVANYIPNNLSGQEKSEGWALLFDGKSADQWRGYNSQDFPEKRWAFSDSAISIADSDGSETGNDLVTREQFGPVFEFQFEFRLTEGANSGVKYFVNEKLSPTGKSGLGFEYQVLDDEKHPDAKLGIAGNRTLASLYDLLAAEHPPGAVKKIGEWNKGRVVAHADGLIEHFLNEQKVLEFNRNSEEFKKMKERSKFKDIPEFGMGQQGHLLLQDHGDNVSFRSLKIRKN